MRRTLEKILQTIKAGFFLFDSPTGFGKTIIVLQ